MRHTIYACIYDLMKYEGDYIKYQYVTTAHQHCELFNGPLIAQN